MVDVVSELKEKLVEIDAQIERLRREIDALDDQRAAFETVIKVYDPEFRMAVAPLKRRHGSSKETAGSRVTEILKGKNNRHVVLDILRRSEKPATSVEVARLFSKDAELGEEAEGLETALASRFSATLDGLQKQGLVKHAGTVDGRKHLWEICR